MKFVKPLTQPSNLPFHIRKNYGSFLLTKFKQIQLLDGPITGIVCGVIIKTLLEERTSTPALMAMINDSIPLNPSFFFPENLVFVLIN